MQGDFTSERYLAEISEEHLAEAAETVGGPRVYLDGSAYYLGFNLNGRKAVIRGGYDLIEFPSMYADLNCYRSISEIMVFLSGYPKEGGSEYQGRCSAVFSRIRPEHYPYYGEWDLAAITPRLTDKIIFEYDDSVAMDPSISDELWKRKDRRYSYNGKGFLLLVFPLLAGHESTLNWTGWKDNIPNK